MKAPASRILLRGIRLLSGFIFLFIAGVVSAEPVQEDWPRLGGKTTENSDPSSWAIAFDNDVLAPGLRDQDYTYGFNVTSTGKRAKNQWASLHRLLARLNRRIGLDAQTGTAISASKFEYGLFGFTPEEISRAEPIEDDRPYASLIYVSSTTEHYDSLREVSWQSTLTLGVMGLGIVGDIQDVVHSAAGWKIPEGWDNQISDGGEPTVRYSVSRQHLMFKSGSGLELKDTWQGSIGYITEVSWSLSTRAGKIHTPWVSFNPELTSYGEKSIPNTTAKISEQYVWAGVSLKLRAYNAFLSGQFRRSAVTYRSDEINHAIVEAWIGYTLALTDGYSFTYSIRAHSSELKRGSGDRTVIWGGVLLSRNFG